MPLKLKCHDKEGPINSLFCFVLWWPWELRMKPQRHYYHISPETISLSCPDWLLQEAALSFLKRTQAWEGSVVSEHARQLHVSQ